MRTDLPSCEIRSDGTGVPGGTSGVVLRSPDWHPRGRQRLLRGGHHLCGDTIPPFLPGFLGFEVPRVAPLREAIEIPVWLPRREATAPSGGTPSERCHDPPFSPGVLGDCSLPGRPPSVRCLCSPMRPPGREARFLVGGHHLCGVTIPFWLPGFLGFEVPRVAPLREAIETVRSPRRETTAPSGGTPCVQ